MKTFLRHIVIVVFASCTLTCSELQQHPASFLDLQMESGIDQVQPDLARLPREVEGEHKPSSIPRPELKRHGRAA